MDAEELRRLGPRQPSELLLPGPPASLKQMQVSRTSRSGVTPWATHFHAARVPPCSASPKDAAPVTRDVAHTENMQTHTSHQASTNRDIDHAFLKRCSASSSACQGEKSDSQSRFQDGYMCS